MYRLCVMCNVFFFKQKTAYEMRISDWSSDVCSSDLARCGKQRDNAENHQRPRDQGGRHRDHEVDEVVEGEGLQKIRHQERRQHENQAGRPVGELLESIEAELEGIRIEA